MCRNVNPKGLAWPDYWFQPGFRKHYDVKEVLAQLDEDFKRFEERLKTLKLKKERLDA